MTLKTCPICHTRLQYDGQPGDYGFDQRCPKCHVKKDVSEWENMKKEMDANKVKREPKEISRSDHPRTCKFCVICAGKLLESQYAHCRVANLEVYKVSVGCSSFLPYALPVQNCSNCRQGMNGLLGNKETHGCKKSVCFPSENQWNSYISCEKFEPKATVLKEAYEYYKTKSKMLEMM